MRRQRLSRPLRLALDHELLAGRSVFDYGCGRGDDIAALRRLGIRAEGWDPVHRPAAAKTPADVVNLGYVINVIERAAERQETLRAAWDLASHCLIVAGRLHHERDDAHIAALHDGYLTRHGTFQKFYDQDELRTWIETTLGARTAAAGPGVFYVFRDERHRQAFLSSRFSRPVRTFAAATRARRAEAHADVLGPLLTFLSERGRPPIDGELAADTAAAVVDAFGSMRAGVRAALLVADPAAIDHARQLRRSDLLVYLALAAFAGARRLRDLDDSTRSDLKTLFESYADATQRADRLLFAAGRAEAIDLAIRAAGAGKVTPAAIYAHLSALHRLPAVLRVYEGCARVFIGTVEGGNVIKLARGEPAVSYLSYPDFDRDPHPALHASVHVDLRRLRADHRDYRGRPNPPILHRKEQFVAADHPRHATFARLTGQEERAGLYADPATIGTRDGWQRALAAAGVGLRGHRVVRVAPA